MDQQEAEQGRRKKRTRVKYRERVRLKERPKGYGLKRFLRKNKQLSTVLTISVVIGLILYLLGLDQTLEALSALWSGFTDLLFNRD